MHIILLNFYTFYELVIISPLVTSMLNDIQLLTSLGIIIRLRSVKEVPQMLWIQADPFLHSYSLCVLCELSLSLASNIHNSQRKLYISKHIPKNSWDDVVPLNQKWTFATSKFGCSDDAVFHQS